MAITAGPSPGDPRVSSVGRAHGETQQLRPPTERPIELPREQSSHLGSHQDNLEMEPQQLGGSSIHLVSGPFDQVCGVIELYDAAIAAAVDAEARDTARFEIEHQ
jgi:hypothetical protein